ncbi:MAG: FAD-binding oxidoreductase [Cohaesibacteraceae bacterium]|nr:FAD-binding oxidoreductase [Cohaesibacteraceae bacterium]MBL4875858.1 FAD-binding oxidoreductase [Cohaesibacteraceae bacterium]
MKPAYDIAIIGGGILGCATALRLADAGMQVVVLEKSSLGQGASGVNAGTLSLQIKRVKLMPYALRGHAKWAAMGRAVGYRQTGGLTLAFNEREEELLVNRMRLKADAGAPIQQISIARALEYEPHLTKKITAASWCELDGYANSSLSGQFYRKQLKNSDVTIIEDFHVGSIDRIDDGGFCLKSLDKTINANRVLLACGGWLKQAATMLGVDLPVQARINTVSATESVLPILSGIIGHATGLLTMKQKPNGTILIGGGWQGTGTPETGRGHVSMETLLPNLSLGQFVLPALANARLVRSWTGFEANVPDFYPLAGALPGVEDAFVLGCVRGGFTIGPYIGDLMGDFILGREPELPLFDPSRNF